MDWLFLLLGLEFPVIMGLLDCYNRDPEAFVDGAAGRESWLRWLVLAVVTVPVLFGFGILLAYYFNVVKGNSAAAG